MKLGDKMPDEFKRRNSRSKDAHKNRNKRSDNRKIQRIYPAGLDVEGLIDSAGSDFSFSLIFSKWKPLKVSNSKAKDLYPPYDRYKKDVLEKLKDQYERFSKSSFIKKKLKTIFEVLKKEGFKCIKAKLKKKAIIGGGGESVLENAIKLHHIYGVPYIPSSSVKGVLRHVALVRISGDEDWKVLQDENEELAGLDPSKKDADDELLDALYTFGSQHFKGRVIFADALPDPEDIPKFSVDVLTPHYMDYYASLYSSEKADWNETYEMGSPNPVFFPVIEGGSFVFCYKILGERPSDGYLRELFKVAFEEGFGAKTRYGYGEMTV